MTGPPEYRFWGLLWRSAVTLNLNAVGVLQVGMGFLLWRYMHDASISMFWFIVLLCTSLSLIMLLFHAYYSAHQLMRRGLPKVVLARKPSGSHEQCHAILLLESSEVFAVGVSITFHVQDENGFETCFGSGTIILHQTDGRIQAAIVELYAGYPDMLPNLLENRNGIHARLLVKPHLTKTDLDLLHQAKGRPPITPGRLTDELTP